jgi:gas vesicle protein
MKNRDKFLIGMLGAAAIGVAIGLLLYTDEGKKRRKKIKNAADDWADSLGSLIASGKENLSDLSQKVIKKVNKIKDKTDEGFENVKNEFERS